MRGGTLQINWHGRQPVLILDFHPASRRLANAGGNHDVKVGFTSVPTPLPLTPLLYLHCLAASRFAPPSFGGGVP